MSKKLRSKDQRLRDRATVARLYCQGVPQWQIGEQLGVTQQQVSLDLKKVRQEWRESALVHIDEKINQEIAKIDNMEREAWAAWERSIDDKRKTTREDMRAGDATTRTKGAVTTETSPGDPRYLQTVQWCITKRCELLGLNAPAKMALTDPTGDKPYEPLTDTERASRLASLLESARDRRNRQAALSAAEGGAEPV